MSEEWKWRIGVDTEEASTAFDDLAAKSRTADDALLKIIETIERLEQHLISLGKVGATGFGDVVSAINIWGEQMVEGIGALDTRLTTVQGAINRVARAAEQSATALADPFAQGAEAADRYAAEIAKLEGQLSKLEAKKQRLGETGVTPAGGVYDPATGEVDTTKTVAMREYVSSLEDYARLQRELDQTLSTGVGFEKGTGAFELYRLETYKEFPQYIKSMEEIAGIEGEIAALVEQEAAARLRAGAAAEQQAQQVQQIQMPEGATLEAQTKGLGDFEQTISSLAEPMSRLTDFFTVSGSTEWTEKFGLGDMTGLEQSLLRTLTIFEQLSGVARNTSVGFAELINTLETLASMRFQPLGSSIMQIRLRVQESTAATNALIEALSKLQSMKTGGAGGAATPLAPPEPVAPETGVGYWADIAGAPYAEVSSSISNIGDLINSAFENADEGAVRAATRIERVMEWLARRVVKGSIVPDMVRDVNFWLSQMGTGASLQGIENIGQAFLETQKRLNKTLLHQAGGVPGYGTKGARAEILFDLGLSGDALQILQDDIGKVMAEASEGQWQKIKAPTGEGVRVPPAFVQELAATETAKHKAQVDELTSSEKELAESAMVVARSLWSQATVSQRKSKILDELAAGTINTAQAEEALADLTKKTGEEIGKTEVLASRFLRHLTWIFQGIVVWGGIRALQNMASQSVETFKSMEVSAAEAAFVTGASIQQIMDMQMQYAQRVTEYGIEPAQVAPAITIAERFGMDDPRIMEYAAQLSMITSEEIEMADATHTIMSVMRQWNLSIDDGSRVLNTLVTLYKTTPGAMGDFMALMKEGPALADQMGQSFEENILMIGRMMSYLPERTAMTLSGTLGRVITRLYTDDLSKKLAQKYGIGVVSPETLAPRSGLDILDEIARKYNSLKTEAEKTAMAIEIAGSRQGRSWRDFTIIMKNWEDGIRGVKTEIVDAADLVNKMKDTTQVAGEEMAASWDLLWQAILRSTGAMETYQSVLRGLIGILDRATREHALFDRAREFGLDIREQEKVYEETTGLEARYPKAGATTPGRTEEFLGWLEKFVTELERLGEVGPGGYFMTGQRGGAPEPLVLMSAMNSSASSFESTVSQAGQDFSDTVSNTAEDMRKKLLTAMLYGGWTPGTGIVDITGPEESPYTMEQVNRAMAESRADTNRMIAAYQQFLAGEGFGGEAIEKAMKEFTDKLMLQLQFFRLPGGQIRLMEGRDLLFYLSQIEENTRPLEGIWNVPEGMRVWVPIESTFYGDWRKQQEEAGDGDVKLDSTGFEDAVQTMGGHLQDFNAQNQSVWENMRLQFTSREEGGTAPAGAGDTLWDARFRDFFTFMQWLKEGREGRETDPLGRTIPTEGADVEFWARFGGSADKYVAAADRFVVGVDGLWGLEWPVAQDASRSPNVGGGAMPRPMPEINLDMYLPLIMKGLEQLYPEMPFGPTEIEIPEPLGVSVSPSQLAQGVAMGTVQTGMPISMMSMQMAQAAQASATTALIYYLMLIANNTAQPATTTVIVEGGTPTTTTVSPSPVSTPPGMMTDWYLGSGAGVVPT